ncbi:MAG: hypothetical protein K2H49_07620 [Muribaculaceae bacterium]|nr:hypothetical protein [Muribaculaceae bacterium]
MKKINIMLFGALAMFAVACESDLEPAIPQENPQEPLMTSGDVVSVAEGPIKDAATPDYVLKLDDYNTETSGIIPVVTVGETRNLPAGASVSYVLELSDSESFARISKVEVIGNLSSETPDTYYVDAREWNDAHLYLFGKSPKVKTVYYRMPVYIDLDGSNYRYESTDYYAFSGTLDETCMDSGFVIEENYYFLSNSTSWDLNNADAVKEFAFYHRPGVSPYDDPVFTYTFSVTQEVIDANGGGCWWKIAPESALGTEDWSKVLGTEINGDESPEGLLIAENSQSGKISEPGRYEITINMESMLYSIKLLPSVVYIVGAPNGWKIDSDALCLSESVKGSNVYSGTLKVDAGQFMFRFYSQLGDWDKGSIGALDVNDGNLDITFTDGVYEGDIYQRGVNASDGKGNWNAPGWAGGAVEITLDLNTNKIVMKEVSVNSGVYLRGDMNGWGSPVENEFILSNKVNVWEVAEVTIDKDASFKVADANWSSVNLGAGSDPVVMPGVACPLVQGSNDNLKMGASFTGKAVLSLNGGEYTLTLEAK